MNVKRYEMNEYNGAAVAEAYSIPAAVDLFCECGAKKESQLAMDAFEGGWGTLVLAPQKSAAADVRGLKAERLLCEEVPGAEVLPLPSALRADGGMADIGRMCAEGERLFCLPGGFMDLKRLRALFCYASAFPVRIAFRPCLMELCEGGQISEGTTADRLGMKGLPAVAESLAAEMLLTLAAEYGVPVHVRTVSCAATLAAVERARAAGLDVTCDVAIANLLHTDEDIRVESLDGEFKVFPPLRSPAEQAALWNALDAGKIDAVVSNHRARGADELALPFEQIPFGSEKLSTALSDLLNSWEKLGRPCTLDRLCEALSAGPRKILGGAESASSQLLDDVGSTLLIRTADGWTVEYDVLKEADQYE